MIAVAYLIPFLACVILRFTFDYSEGAQAYFMIIAFGELTVGGLHWLFHRYQSTAIEFLGSLVKTIHREDSWTELIHTTETQTDSTGKTYTVSKVREKYHPEKYYFKTTIGSKFTSGKSFFYYVAGIWNIEPRHDSWSCTNIKGGRRYGIHYTAVDIPIKESGNPGKWVPVTEKHRYTNRIRRSNSVFKYEIINTEKAEFLGLCAYPTIKDFDAPCVLSRDIPVDPAVDEMFRKFNGRYASQWQMRLYIILYDASRGIGTSEHQRAYWQGGHKNEFTLCIGIADINRIAWAHAFSWAESQQIEIEISQWLISQKRLNWDSLYDKLLFSLPQWKRKQFKDFDYINVTLELWQIALILAGSIVENLIAIIIALN